MGNCENVKSNECTNLNLCYSHHDRKENKNLLTNNSKKIEISKYGEDAKFKILRIQNSFRVYKSKKRLKMLMSKENESKNSRNENYSLYERGNFISQIEEIRKFKWNDGSCYIGYLKNNKPTKIGKVVYKDGDIYFGQWNNGIPEGIALFEDLKGSKYKGHWKNEKQNGYGIESWVNGNYYEGEYYNGQKSGYGIIVNDDKSCYKGQFKNNVMEGIGTYYFENKMVYTGEWKNNKMNGYGIITWPDGKYFEGFFVDDKKNGIGIYSKADLIYFGMWKDSMMDGEGIVITKDQIKKGRWKNNRKIEKFSESYKSPFEVILKDKNFIIKNHILSEMKY